MAKQTLVQKYYATVARMSCCVCQQVPIHVHHIRAGSASNLAAAGRKSPWWATIPLCHNHHQGQEGIHASRDNWDVKVWEASFGTQIELLLRVAAENGIQEAVLDALKVYRIDIPNWEEGTGDKK